MAVETEPVRGEALRYRTTAPLTLWPIEVENVRLSGLPLVAPANPSAAGAVGVLRITLKCASPEATFTPARRGTAALLPARAGEPDAGAV